VVSDTLSAFIIGKYCGDFGRGFWCVSKYYFEEHKLFCVFPTARLLAIYSLSRFMSVGIADLCYFLNALVLKGQGEAQSVQYLGLRANRTGLVAAKARGFPHFQESSDRL
jgi:hypothetical protein